MSAKQLQKEEGAMGIATTAQGVRNEPARTSVSS